MVFSLPNKVRILSSSAHLRAFGLLGSVGLCRKSRGGGGCERAAVWILHLCEHRESPDRLWEFSTERQAKQPVCSSALPFPCLYVPFTGTNFYIKKPDMSGQGEQEFCWPLHSTELHSDCQALISSLQVKKTNLVQTNLLSCQVKVIYKYCWADQACCLFGTRKRAKICVPFRRKLHMAISVPVCFIIAHSTMLLTSEERFCHLPSKHLATTITRCRIRCWGLARDRLFLAECIMWQPWQRHSGCFFSS